MGRILVLFFLLPWWVYIPASLGVVWLAERSYEHALATEAEKAAALEAGLPVAVDLGDFDRDRDIHAVEEVHVTGWINPDFNYELIQKTNGVTTDTRFMFMMFGSGDPAEAREVRAAVMLTPAQREDFIERAYDFITGVTDNGTPIFAFNGFGDSYHTLSGLAKDAIREKGLTRAPDFIFIEPFMEGRVAALAPKGVPDTTRYVGWIAAAVVALIGVVKRVMSVAARSKRTGGFDDEDRDEDRAAKTAPRYALDFTPETPTCTLPKGVSEDTPLGRIARRGAQPKASNVPLPDVYGGSSIEQTRAALAVSDARSRQALARPSAGKSPELRLDSAAAKATKPRRARGDAAPVARAEPLPASSFYARLALAMLVVGGLAYDPSLIGFALLMGGIGLFWYGVHRGLKKLGRNATRLFGNGPTPGRSHGRSPGRSQGPDAGAEAAVTPGGPRLALPGPVRSSRRERGLI